MALALNNRTKKLKFKILFKILLFKKKGPQARKFEDSRSDATLRTLEDRTFEDSNTILEGPKRELSRKNNSKNNLDFQKI